MTAAQAERINTELGREAWVPTFERPSSKNSGIHFVGKPKNADVRHLPRSERKKLRRKA